MEESYSKVVIELMQALADSGDVGSAITVGRSSLRVMANAEEVHVSLIRLLSLAGRGAEAVRHFESYERWLDETYGEPAPAAALDALNSHQETTGGILLSKARQSNPRVGPVLFGRDDDIAGLSRLVQEMPAGSIVTVTGFGGIGKTSLAQAVKASLDSTHRVIFVELASVTEPKLIAPRVLADSGIRPKAGVSALETICLELAGPELIIVLDNAEHLIQGVRKFIPSVAARLPEAKFVVTSRIVLTLPDEIVFPLDLLPTPSDGIPLAAAIRNPAVELFQNTAQRINPQFRVGIRNVSALIELCRRLEGLPLALELAAAKTDVFSVAEILLRLETSRFLEDRNASNIHDRHRSLERVASWSFDLLNEECQQTLMVAAQFPGSFDACALEAIADGDDTLNDVVDLVRASMLQRKEDQEAVRFWLLHPVKAFADDRLNEDARLRYSRKFRQYYAALGEKLRWEIEGPDFSAAADQMEVEHDNFRHCIEMSIADGMDLDATVRLANHLTFFVNPRGHGREWIERLQRLLEVHHSSLTEEEVALANCAIGSMAIFADRAELARSVLAPSLPVFDKFRSAVDRAGIRNVLALALVSSNRAVSGGPESAIELLSEAQALLADQTKRGLWDPNSLSIAISSNMAATNRWLGQSHLNTAILEHALELGNRIGVRRVVGSLRLALMDAALDCEDYERAVKAGQNALNEGETTNTHWVKIMASRGLALAQWKTGNRADSINLVRYAWDLLAEEEGEQAAFTLVLTASMAWESNHREFAASLFGLASQVGWLQNQMVHAWAYKLVPNELNDFDLSPVGDKRSVRDGEVVEAFSRALAILESSVPSPTAS